ncbi:MAG: hypothetical protein C0502_06045 [Opitutus sp.]|nr:hypothetical protein [Opitutus sp.]
MFVAGMPSALLDAAAAVATTILAGETATPPTGQLDFAQVLGANIGTGANATPIPLPASPGWPMAPVTPTVAETTPVADPVLASAPASPPAPIPAPGSPTLPAVPAAIALHPSVVSVSLRVLANPTAVRPLVNHPSEAAPARSGEPEGGEAQAVAGAAAPVAEVVWPESVSSETDSGVAPERSRIEAALALVFPLLAHPTAPLPRLPEAPWAVGSGANDALPTGAQESSATSGNPTMVITLKHPAVGPAQVELPLAADGPLSLAEVAAALVPEKFARPQSARAENPAARQLPLAEQSPSTLLAEIKLADGTQVAVSVLARQEPRPAPTVVLPASIARPEKNAAPGFEVREDFIAGKSASEKNFLSSAKPAVTPARVEAGIGVAQDDHAMPPVSPAPIATVHAAVPVAALVEKIAAAEPAPLSTPPVGGLAHRAVETVTDVVEAQAASRLQPVPSVQLRFKVGGEDLSVRVELRNGGVHTEFLTDSAELRSALAQEWRAVTARSDATVRYLDPVIMPSSSSGQGSSPFSHGQSSSSHHQHAQQQFRAQAEVFGSVGRSFSAAPQAPEPSADVAPLVLPATHRLSAVA